MTDNQAQLRSKSYLLPVADTEFLLRDEMRGLRFQLEYSKAELALRDWQIRSTVVVFGSARIPSPEAAAQSLAAASGEKAKRLAALAPYYGEARAFGRLVSLNGGAIAEDGALRGNVIATGGGPGVMVAGKRGAN